MKIFSVLPKIFLSLLLLSFVRYNKGDVIITVQRLSNRVINLRVGDDTQFGDIICNNVVAIASSNGLIIIDTGYYPQSAKSLRKIISHEFGRDDFAWVINTHWHWDHINGNQAFSDVPIIGHENIISSLQQFEKGLGAFIRQRKERIQAWREQLQTLESGSKEEQTARGWLFAHRQFIKEYDRGYKITYPSVTFSDHKIIDMGDLTLHLFHIPGFHTDNDILVYIPEEKILAIGDLLYNKYLPRIKHSTVQFLPEILTIFKPFVNGEKPVKTVIPGHKSLMTGAALNKQIEYIQMLWNQVRPLKDAGSTLEELKKQLDFQTRFDYLKDFPFFTNSQTVHIKNIENIWFGDKASVILKLKQLIDKKNFQEAVKLFREECFDTNKYHFSEEEFLDYGYDCLLLNQMERAVNIFSMYLEIDPTSWLIWDSLGEAWIKAGNSEQAKTCFQQSLKLNPQNSNAESILRELSRIQAWEHMGQDPPGSIPVLFMPNVVSTDYHEYSIAISNDLTEIFFTRHKGDNSFIYHMFYSRGEWTEPEKAGFSGQFSDYDQNFSPDSKVLYFVSDRPRKGTPYIGDIYAVEKQGILWGVPFRIEGQVNTVRNEAYPSANRKGELYFHAAYNGSRGKADIYKSELQNRIFTNPINLGEAVNSEYNESDAFIDPDNRYIIFCSDRPGGYGNKDLYISFKSEQGQWLPAQNLGSTINTGNTEYCPSVSPDGKYLFFTRRNPKGGDIYWVDAGVIEELGRGK